MIAALALLLTFASPIAASNDDELVVIARKVDSVSLTVGRDAEGHTTCGIGRSSGDAAIDDKLCRIASKCVKPGPIDETAVHACVEVRKPRLVATLAQAAERAGPQP